MLFLSAILWFSRILADASEKRLHLNFAALQVFKNPFNQIDGRLNPLLCFPTKELVNPPFQIKRPFR
jgi:hypothetical protein